MKAALLVLAVLSPGVAFAACGGGDDTTTVITQEAPTTTTTVEKETGGGGAAPAPEPEPEPEPEPATGTVPDVVDERLDVGNRAVKDAGYDTRFVGGGVFGVVVLRNWVICDQEPAGGTSAPAGTKVDLIVDRSC